MKHTRHIKHKEEIEDARHGETGRGICSMIHQPPFAADSDRIENEK